VERARNSYTRPRNVIVPGALVDAAVICKDVPKEFKVAPVLSGGNHAHPSHMDYWMGTLGGGRRAEAAGGDSADIIGERAAKELSHGDIVNIGIGIPEMVGVHASRSAFPPKTRSRGGRPCCT
jgi:acyl CoA:acetate/3-ketoacid CoA transferase